MTTARSLAEVFLDTAKAFPQRPAIEAHGGRVTYAQLRHIAQVVASSIIDNCPRGGPPLAAVLGQPGTSTFAGILGVLCSGRGYVPMPSSLPAARIATMLARSEVRTLVVDASGAQMLGDVLDDVPQSLSVLLLDDEANPSLQQRWPRHRLVGPSELVTSGAWTRPRTSPDAIAYLLFTSGSTGQPKGVMVAHRNIVRFLDVVTERFDLRPEDRFSHMFDISFDLSLFDLFAAWRVGGCLCCPDARGRLLPAQYVVDAGITVWFSVPSTALLMKQMRQLTPNAFPDLRLSLFCGEALTVAVAEAWAEAAPQSIVENLYGPTELTLACTGFRWDDAGRARTEGDVVPIGEPFPGMEARVVDEALQPVEPGTSGELIMTGPQLALGYYEDPERTAAAFVTPPGETRTFYRTGDLVRRTPAKDGDGEGPLLFLGRIDSQVKVRGYRVELGEIEAALREEGGLDVAVALGWPMVGSGGAEGVVAFIDDATVDVAALLDRVATRLPKYMVPREVRVLEVFPHNANGKIDRPALRAMLEAGAGED